MRVLSCVGLLRRAGIQVVRSNRSNSTNAPDPFGLDAVEATALHVQGIKSDGVGASAAETPSPPPAPDTFEEYNRWIEFNKKRSESLRQALHTDSEVILPAAFGTIRLDKDNLAKEDDEYPAPDTRPPVVRVQRSFLKPKPASSDLNSEETKVPEAKESVKKKGKTGGQGDVHVLIPESETETTEPTIKTPLIYQIQPLNHLTHADVWNILRKQVVFENDFLLAINKPFGLPMHNPSTDSRHTLNDFLTEFATLCHTESVFPLHRIDKDTTGVLLLAKTQEAATIIKERFYSRKVKKTYLVITKNCPEVPEGTVRIPIAEGKIGKSYRSILKPDLREFNIASSQSRSKEAITHFKVIKSIPDAAFLEVSPETGLKHQIRIHLATGLGSPILGDHKYSHRDKLAPQRLSPSVLKLLKVAQSRVRDLPIHLHCSSIQFSMPSGFSKGNEDVFVHSRPPKYFIHTLNALGLK